MILLEGTGENVSLGASPVHMVEHCTWSYISMAVLTEPEKGDSRRRKIAHKPQMNSSREQRLLKEEQQNHHLCSVSEMQTLACQQTCFS